MNEDESWSSVSTDGSEDVRASFKTSTEPRSFAEALRRMQESVKDQDEKRMHQNSNHCLETAEQSLKLELERKDKLLASLQSKLTEKDELLASHQDQLESLQNQFRDLQNQLDDLKKSKCLATDLLKATLRTETFFLENLDGCAENDILDTILSLLSGSEELNVSELKAKAVNFAKAAMEHKSLFAVQVLAAYDASQDSLKDPNLETLALAKIRSNPKLLLEENSCMLLGADRMESMMGDKKMEADEYTMFRILCAWSRMIDGEDETKVRRDLSSDLLAKHIALDLIDPNLLYSSVRDSGLVTDTQLVEAFGKQAPLAKQSLSLRQRAYSVVWKSSNTDLVLQPNSKKYTTQYLLLDDAMKTGIYKWSFRVEEKDPKGSMCFGITRASAKQIVSPDYVGRASDGWSICTNGNICWCGTPQGQVKSAKDIKASSTISFALQLKGGNENHLEISIDGGEPVTLFQGEKLLGDGIGFIPAVSTWASASIRLLGFEVE